jgi:2-oxoglutarate-Fe(II)-dependent oxygenase superfamily protein
MKRLIRIVALALCCAAFCSEESGPPYPMITVPLIEGEAVFQSDEDFNEVMRTGFFRIKAPEDLNLEAGRTFAKTFMSMPRYNQFGILDVVNGYLQSEIAQTVRFSLERDHWHRCYVDLKDAVGPPNFPPEIQQLGHKMNRIATLVLRSILKKFQLPELLWFEATSGCTHGEGSYFLLFNCYDPAFTSKPYGVGPHKDWGHVSVLDASGPGLEAKIDGIWRPIHSKDGYLIVNFGIVLEKLLPGVTASEHRVVTQREKMRTSIVAFADPRVGPYRGGVTAKEKEGYVYDWDPLTKELKNGVPTTDFFHSLSVILYGEDQTSKTGSSHEID